MILFLDIKDDKAPFFMEVLKNFSFVKATPISPAKARSIKDFKDAVDEVSLARQGKIKLKSADQIIDEL